MKKMYTNLSYAYISARICVNNLVKCAKETNEEQIKKVVKK